MEEYKGFRADRLKKAMEENGVTAEDIANTIAQVDRHIGIECVKDIVTERNPYVSLYILCLICKAVNVSADYLLGLSDEMYW